MSQKQQGSRCTGSSDYSNTGIEQAPKMDNTSPHIQQLPLPAATATATAPTASLVRYRVCRPTDIPICAEIEAASYPADEAASKSVLQYRQHHAARYFLCAVLRSSSTTTTTVNANNKIGGADNDDSNNLQDDDCNDTDTVIGFVCSTKCHAFAHESMSVHEPAGRLLAVHSVVVAEPYRRQGIATRLLREYVRRITAMAAAAAEPEDPPPPNCNSGGDAPPRKIVLLAKAPLLAFYVKCGFRVM